MKLSIIICTYNREEHILRALLSLELQDDLAENYEVIIVNNNSSDSTEKLVKSFISNTSRNNFKYIFEKQQGLSFARNRGIHEASGEVVFYMDDDANAHNSLVSETLRFYKRYPNAIGMGGRVLPYYESNEPEWMNSYLEGLVTLHNIGNKIIKYKNTFYPVGCAMSYKKSALLKSGGFNNSLKWRADDKYMYYEIVKISDEVYYNPSVVLMHFIDDYRLTHKNFSSICEMTGKEEKIRVKSNDDIKMNSKIMEYLFKYIATFPIWILFTLKGQYIKGKYVNMYRRLALKGLMSK